MELLTYILAGITISGAIIGLFKWYKNKSIAEMTERFKDDGVHDKFNMKIKDLEKESRFILERQISLEEEIQEARREIAELRGKLE